MVYLRAEREQAGLTQARLAELTGIATANLSAYESGKRPASNAMVQRIRDAMIRPSERLNAHRAEVLRAIEQNGGTNPRVIGSVARGEDTTTSDLDILVAVQPDLAWEFVSTGRELSDLLGVNVDVVIEGGLKDKHESIRNEVVPL